MKATCICCLKEFEITDWYRKQVDIGKMEALCPICSDDFDDDERQSDDDIDEAEYKYGDR